MEYESDHQAQREYNLHVLEMRHRLMERVIVAGVVEA